MTLALQLNPKLSSQTVKEERHLHVYRKSAEIPVIAQGFWQVERGMVQVSTICSNGDEVILGWVGSGNYFGQSWFPRLNFPQEIGLTKENFYASYRGISDVYLKWYNINEIETNPALAPAILNQLTKRLQQTERLLAMGGYKRVEERLYQLFLLLKSEMGQSVPQGTRLNYRLTHQHLANAIGTTRVTVTRLLGRLQEQGCIEIDSQRHIVLKGDRFDRQYF